MTWNPKQKTLFLSRLADMVEQTCALAVADANRSAEVLGARVSRCRAAIANLRRGQMPDTAAMQDLLATAGSLTTQSSLSSTYAFGAASSDVMVRLHVDKYERPLELVAPHDLLRTHNIAPERALLVHLCHTEGDIPEGDILLVEKTPISLDRKPFAALSGSIAILREVAAVAPYTLLSCDYGIFTSCQIHRLAEEDGITPLGRAVATFSGTPLPEIGKGQSNEFDLLCDAWKHRRR